MSLTVLEYADRATSRTPATFWKKSFHAPAPVVLFGCLQVSSVTRSPEDRDDATLKEVDRFVQSEKRTLCKDGRIQVHRSRKTYRRAGIFRDAEVAQPIRGRNLAPKSIAARHKNMLSIFTTLKPISVLSRHQNDTHRLTLSHSLTSAEKGKKTKTNK